MRRPLERRTYHVEASPEILDRLEAFFALLHFNGGHSGLFAMSFDGDGSDRFRVSPAPEQALKERVNKIGGAGGSVEIAHDDGSYTCRSIDYSRPRWTVDKDGLHKEEGENALDTPTLESVGFSVAGLSRRVT